jgi:hypothetical protein
MELTLRPIYFLYNDELNAEENWQRLKSLTKGDATAFKSIGTIFESHKAIADSCYDSEFYVVDGDCWILDNFNFDQKIDLKPRSVAVFRAKNPINGLVYGHGGIKLFSKDCFSTERLDSPDMTTTLADAYIKVNVLASEHRFNYTPFSTWRTAFREAVKLSSGINKNNNDQESQDRLTMWCQAGLENNYGYFSLIGARQGVAYAKKYKNNLDKVNEFAWLEEQFINWIGV